MPGTVTGFMPGMARDLSDSDGNLKPFAAALASSTTGATACSIEASEKVVCVFLSPVSVPSTVAFSGALSPAPGLTFQSKRVASPALSAWVWSPAGVIS